MRKELLEKSPLLPDASWKAIAIEHPFARIFVLLLASVGEGAQVVAYDPKGMDKARSILNKVGGRKKTHQTR